MKRQKENVEVEHRMKEERGKRKEERGMEKGENRTPAHKSYE